MIKDEVLDKAFNDEFWKLMEKMMADEAKAVEHLTREQFISALKQAIASGDFTRYLVVTNEGSQGQQVVYLPFARVEDLQGQLDELKILVRSSYHALRAYQFSNSSPNLAKEVADQLEHHV